MSWFNECQGIFCDGTNLRKLLDDWFVLFGQAWVFVNRFTNTDQIKKTVDVVAYMSKAVAMHSDRMRIVVFWKIPAIFYKPLATDTNVWVNNCPIFLLRSEWVLLIRPAISNRFLHAQLYTFDSNSVLHRCLALFSARLFICNRLPKFLLVILLSAVSRHSQSFIVIWRVLCLFACPSTPNACLSNCRSFGTWYVNSIPDTRQHFPQPASFTRYPPRWPCLSTIIDLGLAQTRAFRFSNTVQ